MTDARIETSHFSTVDLPPEKRFDAWHEGASVVFDVAAHDEASRARFSADIYSILLGDVPIIRCRLGAQRLTRSTQRIANDGIDHFELILFVHGKAELEFDGRPAAIDAGMWMNLDFTGSLAAQLPYYETLNIFIPRRRLTPLLTAPDSVHGAIFPSNDGAGRLLKDYLLSLFAIAPDMAQADAGAASEALVQLAALAINGASWDGGDPPALANPALALRAQAYIRRHLSDPSLSPAKVATGIGISRARLYRVFSPSGGVADYIREMRLRRCFSDLVSRDKQHLQISQIAYGWGFNDPNHFSKLFKARFDATPGDVRAAGAGAALRAVSGHYGDVDLSYSNWISTIA